MPLIRLAAGIYKLTCRMQIDFSFPGFWGPGERNS